MKSLFKVFIYFVGTLIALIILFLVGFQLLQAAADRAHHGGASGIILDQDGNPLSGVEITFDSWNWRMYVPIPFSPTKIVHKIIKATTDANGVYSVSGSYPRTSFVSIAKAGYRQDGPETENIWHSYGTPKPGPWDFHLVNESLIQASQIKSIEFSTVSFSNSGKIGLNLAEGIISDTTSADVVFVWRRLPATAEHGDYGKFTIYTPESEGVWFWEQDRLFAPKENYERGATFIFGTKFLGKTSYTFGSKRRCEFFVKARNGKVFARLYAELNSANGTLCVRGRINTTGSRFVDAKGGAYGGIQQSSMSADYLNSGTPWWISMDSIRSQIIMPDERLAKMATNFTAYFAGHYQTPPEILEWLTTSNLIHDHYIPQYLARNYSASPHVLSKLIEIDPAGARWFGKDAQAVLHTPDDVKNFFRIRDY